MPTEEYMAAHQDPRDLPYSIMVFQESMEEAIQLIDRLRTEVDGKDAENERLKTLLLRAADALEDEFGQPTFEGRDLSERHPWKLIIELRKASAFRQGLIKVEGCPMCGSKKVAIYREFPDDPNGDLWLCDSCGRYFDRNF